MRYFIDPLLLNNYLFVVNIYWFISQICFLFFHQLLTKYLALLYCSTDRYF